MPSEVVSQVQELHVRKSALAETRGHQRTEVPLAEGQVRLAIERFALTANNITYAALGTQLGYWDFFPLVDDDWGLLPVWGFARVTESRQALVEVGTRVYGLLPMASQTLLSPVRVGDGGFFDGAAHRMGMHPVYKRYALCSEDPLYTPGTEDLQAVLRPLIITSWLVADLVQEQISADVGRVVVSSASSKTAFGTALTLRRNGRVKVIGLTSRSNVPFCTALGCYDQVLAYEDLDALDADAPCVYVDYAGNMALRKTVHEHFRALRLSLAIGYTHVDQLAGAQELPGPPVIHFFAPDRIRQRHAQWGAPEFTRRLAAAYAEFARFCTAEDARGLPLLSIQHHEGLSAALAIYQALLRGQVDPQLANVFRFMP